MICGIWYKSRSTVAKVLILQGAYKWITSIKQNLKTVSTSDQANTMLLEKIKMKNVYAA